MVRLLRAPRSAASRLLARFILPMQTMRASQFAALPVPQADVVFLGDSITEYGLWNEWFPGLRVVNRGIAGDTADGVLARLGTAIGSQRIVSLLIGTNDLGLGAPPDRIAENVAAIVGGIRAAAPDSEIILNSVMPRGASFRDRVLALNERLEAAAPAEGVTFVDLWPALADERGELRAEFTADRLHLTGAGYLAWVAVLREHIR